MEYTKNILVVFVLAVLVGGCTSPGISGHGSTESIAAPAQDAVEKPSHGGNLDEYISAMGPKERAAWQKPDEVISALDLKEGEKVADVGCGPGYFTLRLAKEVGATGRVWAVDIKQIILDQLRKHVNNAGLGNIEYVLAPPDDPLLPPGQIDTIFIVDTYHHFSDRPAYIKKLSAALTPKGRIVIIDFIPKAREERGFGPPTKMQIARETVDAEMAEAGLCPVKVHTFLPEQYFVEYRLKGAQ